MIDEQLIRQLAHPHCYPDTPELVEQHQTHLSLVCVAGKHAYKLKKSLQLPFVDFSTLELRRQACEQEVALNRRLCPTLYLDVVALITTAQGPRFLASSECGMPADATVLDYAVRMRRLPADRMLDVLLADDQVDAGDLREIADIMVAFHEQAVLGDSSQEEAVASAGRLRDFALANFEETRTAAQSGLLDSQLHRSLHQRTRTDFEWLVPLLEERARSGRVVDGHGDLHARNICLCHPPAIYDCIEFNRDLRIQDVATENAFLAMDLRFRGRENLARAYIERYTERTGDLDQLELIPVLLRYRAMVRCKVAAIAAGEKELPTSSREAETRSTRRHLLLAAASAVEAAGNWLICATGLPGSGKTHAFTALSRDTGWPHLASDAIRKQLAGVDATAALPASAYSPAFSELTYDTMLGQAERRLADGPVLLDANFSTSRQRGKAAACALRAGARLAFAWFQATEKETSRRLQQRAHESQDISDADFDIYLKLKAGYETPAGDACLLISCDASPDSSPPSETILLALLDGAMDGRQPH